MITLTKIQNTNYNSIENIHIIYNQSNTSTLVLLGKLIRIEMIAYKYITMTIIYITLHY